MKRTTILRPFNFALALFAVASFSLTSCKDKPADTEEIAEDQNEMKFDENTKENDAEFLVNAAEINMMQVELGKLAEKSANTEVSSHGKMMVEQHTAAAEELKALAAAKAITIPMTLTEDGMDAVKKLSEKKVEDFDMAYIDMMVDGHKDAVDKFENNAERTKDMDIQAFANKMLPTLRTHLEHFTALKDKMKK